MSGEHTPGPWARGITLVTATTKRWTDDQIEENDRRERRMVFARFSSLDEGRSRVRVAICEREEDALLISQAPLLLQALEEILALDLENDGATCEWSELVRAARKARFIVARATGSEA